MKNLFKISILLILGSSFILSECISGDCENGYGTKKYKDNSYYTGEWKNGNMNGYGKYVFNKHGDECEGEYLNNQINGYGICRTLHGTYSGEFKNDIHHGMGSFIFPNGNKFVGNYVDNLPNGMGFMNFINGDEILGYLPGTKYIGDFVNGYPQGYGSMIYTDGKVKNGLWKKGRFISN